MPRASETTRWVLFGAGGHAHSIADVLARRGDEVVGVVGAGDGWSVEQFADDESGSEHAARVGAAACLAMGDGTTRLRLLDALRTRGLALPPVVASTATVSADAVLEPGVVVLEHAHVGPRAVLGGAAVVNTGAIVEHDVTVGSGAHVAPGAVVLGGASIGREALVGGGSVVLLQVTVGEGAVLGAGSTAVGDVAPGQRWAGNPARPIA